MSGPKEPELGPVPEGWYDPVPDFRARKAAHFAARDAKFCKKHPNTEPARCALAAAADAEHDAQLAERLGQ